MLSIYQRALGGDFDRLHPRIQERFGLSSTSNLAAIGEGIMHHISYAKWATLPLKLGTTRNIMFPQGGEGIPFTIANYAYQDCFGRETVTWHRTFQFEDCGRDKQRARQFDATMIYSDDRRRIVDYLGTKQHLAVDLSLSVGANGGMHIRSAEQRFYEGLLQFRFPGKLTGIADVCEWYDETERQYQIQVEVKNPLFGRVFYYRGSFQVRYVPMTQDQIPISALPLRTEIRE